MTTEVIKFLNRPLFHARTSNGDIVERRTGGIILQPWMVTLIISFLINAIGFAFAWGTVVSRLEALAERVGHLERQVDTLHINNK